MAQEVAEKIQSFFTTYPRRTYPKGQIIIFANEDPQFVFYIAKGKVSSYDISYKGDEVTVNLFKPDSFFPMSWAINKTKNVYFYRTEVETTLHVVPPEDVLNFISKNPDVLLDLMGRVYKGIDGLLGRLTNMMAGSAKERLLFELVLECRRFGTKKADDSYQLDISESDLAARTGLTRETVNREIHKIKRLDLVSVSPKGILIKNFKGLKKQLSQEL